MLLSIRSCFRQYTKKQEDILSIRLSIIQLSTYALYAVVLTLSIATVIIFVSMISKTGVVYGQLPSETMGVNITSPERGNTIPVGGGLTVSGKSTDDPFDENCEVSVIVNNVRPYQPATANGSTGQANDYSQWFFILSNNYTSIKEGINEITSRLSCLPSTTTVSNLTKWYSVNVTGVIVGQNATITSAPTTTALPPTFTPSPDGLPTEGLFTQEPTQGGNEPDIIEGSLFADDIDGENGDDRVQGSGGDDAISGGNGDDYLQGDEGNDNLRGENGDDMLFGGNGDEVLGGGNGSDNFNCGGGTDTIVDFSAFQDEVKSNDCEIS